MTNKELCENCIYNDAEGLFKGDCEICKDGSNRVTYEEFNADMDIWNEEPPSNEIDKPIYFPIRWLINKIADIEQDCNGDAFWFTGISLKPFGQFQWQSSDFPLYLRLLCPCVFVNQWRDGGYSGDDFAGTMYFFFFGVWLTFNYEC